MLIDFIAEIPAAPKSTTNVIIVAHKTGAEIDDDLAVSTAALASSVFVAPVKKIREKLIPNRATTAAAAIGIPNGKNTLSRKFLRTSPFDETSSSIFDGVSCLFVSDILFSLKLCFI
ncbi:MAG: hypothetical protein U0R17_05590 [Acidimicrobiia bacterium]